MWENETEGRSTASAERLYALFADVGSWSSWNAGVAGIEMQGPFEAGAEARMVFPDGSALPFAITWAEPGLGYEDLTEVQDAGVAVRVRHELHPAAGGTRILYRCRVEGEDGEMCAAVGRQVSSDFGQVIAGLAAAAEA